MLIGITGTDGAGKGTVVSYLVEKKGFTHYSARVLFVDELNTRKEEVTRVNMLKVANEFREKFGTDFIVSEYLKKIAVENPENAIIESIRSVGEAETLKENNGILIAVNANQETRFKRIQERQSKIDKVSFEEFVKNESAELDDPSPFGAKKLKVIKMADYTILNELNFKELYTQIEEILKKIEQ